MTPETGEAIDVRARVVARARSFLGPNGEPKDQDPNIFFRIAAPQFADKGHEHNIAWCGIFALSCLKLEGLAPDITWTTGKGFVYHLHNVPLPEPGDVVVFGAPLWHHAIVESVADGKVHTIDGNVIPFPREGCGARVRPIDAGVQFYSIHTLIADPGT